MKNKQKKPQKQSIKESEFDDNQLQKTTLQDKLPDKEIGGRKGLEPTRYGDWEKNGRCVDF